MDVVAIGAFLLLILLLLLGSGIWVGISLLGVGTLGMVLFTGAPAGKVMATTTWGSSTSWALTALPLFIWMAEILYRSRLSEDMFHGLAPWLSRLPGRLMHVNIIGCGIFAAISGSSPVTLIAVGSIMVPAMVDQKYPEDFALGICMTAGSLGCLVPPAISMLIYAISVSALSSGNVDPSQLFMAGLIPALRNASGCPWPMCLNRPWGQAKFY